MTDYETTGSNSDDTLMSFHSAQLSPASGNTSEGSTGNKLSMSSSVSLEHRKEEKTTSAPELPNLNIKVKTLVTNDTYETLEESPRRNTETSQEKNPKKAVSPRKVAKRLVSDVTFYNFFRRESDLGEKSKAPGAPSEDDIEERSTSPSNEKRNKNDFSQAGRGRTPSVRRIAEKLLSNNGSPQSPTLTDSPRLKKDTTKKDPPRLDSFTKPPSIPKISLSNSNSSGDSRKSSLGTRLNQVSTLSALFKYQS